MSTVDEERLRQAHPDPERPDSEYLDPERALDALRARGAHRVDPVRLRFIEALAGRAASRQGASRRLLDVKLEQMLDACSRVVEQSRSESAATLERPPSAAPKNSPSGTALSDLLAHIARHAAQPDAPLPGHAAGARPPAELKTVRYFRSTWSRLSVDRRMAQALENVPEGAGPINTQRLLHQALTTMRDASPEYLLRFMSQVEALLCLAQAASTGPGPGMSPTRGARGRKPVAPGRRDAAAAPDGVRQPSR